MLLGSLLVTVCAEPIATLDRTLWPDSLASHHQVNAASRLEILNFASELMGSELVAPDEWPQHLGLPQVDMLAIDTFASVPRAGCDCWPHFRPPAVSVVAAHS